jgi:Dolichyl-phosphate-mannose-protein mannosyltransferase
MIDPTSRSAGRRNAVEAAIVVAILIAVGLGAASVIAHGSPMGWDESVYASKSRSLLTDIPASLWAIYRPPGLPVIGLLGGAFGFVDANLRAVTLVLGLLTLAGAWALARALWGPLAGILALVTAIGAPIVMNELVLFHTDVAAAGLLVALMLLCWNEFERRPEPGALFVAAAPLAALAFYVRFGSLVAIVGIGIGAVVLWHRPMLRHWRLTGLTVALAVLLVVPHVAESIALTGSPVGILTSASGKVNTSGPLVTAEAYLRWLPLQLAHVLGFLMMVAGVLVAAVAAVDAVRRRSLTAAARRFLWLYVPAGITVVGLVFLSHAERRYMMFPVLLGIVAGAGGVSLAFEWLKSRPRFAGRAHPLELMLVGGIIAATLLVGYLGTRRIATLERGNEPSRWLIAVGRAIDADATGPCTVATTIPPIVGWYSACRAVPFSQAETELPDAGASSDASYVMFSAVDGQRASPELIQLHRTLVAGGSATAIPVPGAPAGVEVYRLTP